MSTENVDLISALQPDSDVDLAGLFRDDESWANLREIFEQVFHDDIETGFVGVGQESRSHGVDGFREVWLEWVGPWETYRADIDQVIDCDDDVLVITNDYGRKPGMTAEVRLFGAAVWSLREDLIAKAYFYADRGAALDAVGLSPGAVEGRS